MTRNIILAVSTLAVLLLMFAGYTALVGGSAPDERASGGAMSSIPMQTDVDADRKLTFRDIGIDPGQKMAYINYDPVTGQPTDYFRVDTWEKVPGTTDEILVTGPELMMLLPSGMTLTISADRGQLKAESASRKRVQPKYGWLEGDARLVIDRGTVQGRPPLSERPEDQITIEMDRLDFNLELGELKTFGRLHVSADEFDVAGAGLHMVWNQNDNRIEKLLIDGGGEMMLKGALMSALGGVRADKSESDQATQSEQPTPTLAPARRAGRRGVTYRCVLDGGISVEHRVGEQLRASVSGDELALLFDIGRGGGGGGELPKRAPTSAPASQPSKAPAQQIVVKWAGKLSMLPQAQTRKVTEPRRQVTIAGEPVNVRLPRGAVECGRLELHEQSKRLWLYPVEGGAVRLTAGDNLSVQAVNMFVDMDTDKRIVKLLGDVRFQSLAGAAPLEITCDIWAELHLAAEGSGADSGDADLFNNPLASSAPESAVFVGDVDVEFQQQNLRTHRLEAYFRSANADAAADRDSPDDPVSSDGSAPMGMMLERAAASGDVHLIIADSSARDGWRRTITRNVGVARRSLARTLATSFGTRHAGLGGDGERSLRCASLLMHFAPIEGGVRIRELQGDGAVALRDPNRRFAVRGRRIHATVSEANEIQHATVSGYAARPAFVQARGYVLRGGEIAVDNEARTLHVDGRSRLAFRSRSGLQGLTRLSDETVTVVSNESLHIDAPRDSVAFVGAVVAGTSNEQLLADTLTLTLTDAPDQRSPSVVSSATHVLELMRGGLSGQARNARDTASFLDAARPRGSSRKELIRVLAHNAGIRSTAGQTARGEPLAERSLTCPDLDIDVRQRIIRTVGRTVMGMTTRAGDGASRSSQASLGMMSGLASSGPSLAFMKCDNGMIYALGAEDGPRQDNVLFEGDVQFQRIVAKQPSELDQLVQQLRENGGPLPSVDGQHTIVKCNRMEVRLESADAATAVVGGPSMRFAWLNAVGNVYLRDQRQANIRSVYSHQLEYDDDAKLVRVLGLPEKGIDARVYDENVLTGRLNMPAQGPEIIIHLDTKTIEAKNLRGHAGG